ncbi:unnamed protein product [Spirodela intermedia]|uniref:Acyl-coenzyme A oxidase n=1 Tax=Spirodela intermedia TaxID=51605 RepID=A0A7I8IU54_SPIIN|nr:unnamed protein product [Spirodela intermedia]CAA6661080.1 unnamed protein product [Spirodela intermedia]
MASPDADRIRRRASVISRHLSRWVPPAATRTLNVSACVQYSPPESSEKLGFDVGEMRRVMDGHDVEARDWAYRIMEESPLFWSPRRRPEGRVFMIPDYNQPMEHQREMTMRRIMYLKERGMYDGWLTGGRETEMRRFALLESAGLFDHSLSVKTGVHFFLWGLAIRYLGTKYHHDKWLKDSENLSVKGCFAMTELGHGSNVRGIETIATYDSSAGEFIINTPCESAQKYWIGGAACKPHYNLCSAAYTRKNQGVHAFAARIRDDDGNVCPNIRIADCGHKIGLNGVDNGRIWFDNLRVPRQNLLNSVCDVLPDGQYVSVIEDPDQRFAAFLAPLTFGRTSIIASAVYSSKVALSIAIRYALTRRAFSIEPNGPEVPLLDYPTHQRRLLPLVAKTNFISFFQVCYELCGRLHKADVCGEDPEMNKAIHIYSSAFKASMTWHNMRTLQECREACGGQGLKTENRVGVHKGEFDVQSTFEGDNNILMQQVSKALLAEYITAQRRRKPFKGLGLEHMNDPSPVIPANLTSSVVRSIQFQTDMLRLRERDLLGRLAKEISDHQARGKERSMLSSCYQVSEELGRAFSDLAVLQTLVEAEMAATDGPVKEVLGLLRTTYALIIIEEDASFLRYGFLTPGGATVVRKEVGALCGELRPHALSIVTSFGIPPSLLSPLAFDWVEANSWPAVDIP